MINVNGLSLSTWLLTKFNFNRLNWPLITRYGFEVVMVQKAFEIMKIIIIQKVCLVGMIYFGDLAGTHHLKVGNIYGSVPYNGLAYHKE